MLHSSEEIERESLEELHSVAPTKVREDLGLVGRNIGSAFVSAASTLPKTAVVLNRTIGVGLGAPETSKSIDQIVDVYRSANVSRYFIQVHPEARPVELEDWLLKRGVTKARAWQKFSRGREPVAPPSTDLSIKKIGGDLGNNAGSVLCQDSNNQFVHVCL